MEPVPFLDCAGRRRSPVTLPWLPPGPLAPQQGPERPCLLVASGELRIDGDASKLATLLGLLGLPDRTSRSSHPEWSEAAGSAGGLGAHRG